MVDLVVELQGSTNFYTPIGDTWLLGYTGFAAGSKFTVKVEVLEYTGTAQLGYIMHLTKDPAPNGPCFVSSWITPAGNPRQTVTGTFDMANPGVEWTATSGASGCLDFDRMYFEVKAYDYPGSWTVHIRISLSFIPSGLPPVHCQYGTRLKSGTPLTVLVSPDFVDLTLTAIGVPWAASVFAGYLYKLLDLNQLCASPPAQGVTIDMTTWTSSAESVWRTFQWASWYSNCECVPGDQPTTPYPPPVITQPTNWPSSPTFNCDPAVLCDALNRIQKQLAALSSAVTAIHDLDTLMQRYRLPMAVTKGAVHSGLTQSGAFAISRLVGVQVEITARDTNRLQMPGQPNYLWDMGWISMSDQGAMLQEQRLTRDRQTWIPEQGALATVFGYYLTPGTQISVTELEAEP